MTVHSFARSKLPRQNMMNDVRLFSRVLVLGNSMHIDNRQSIQLCPPHTGLLATVHLCDCCQFLKSTMQTFLSNSAFRQSSNNLAYRWQSASESSDIMVKYKFILLTYLLANSHTCLAVHNQVEGTRSRGRLRAR